MVPKEMKCVRSEKLANPSPLTKVIKRNSFKNSLKNCHF